MKRIGFAFIFFIMSTMLSACLYPQDKLVQNTIPYNDQIQSVQAAVEQYKENNNGVLPIKTKDFKTPIYEKYPIEFKLIYPTYMSEVPGNAYEGGGVYQYVLVHVESSPTVKLLDLRITDRVQQLQMRIDMYRDKHQYPPFDKVISEDVYTIDYKRLNIEEWTISSPFSQNKLPFVMDANGKVFVDYTIDILDAMEQNEVDKNEDAREILVKHSMFVPAHSLPYKIENEKPIFFIQ